MVLRLREPELPRPFRCWAYPLPPLLVGAVSVVFLAGMAVNDPLLCATAAMLVALGWPLSLLTQRQGEQAPG
jgi:APA family basic amino acid/polyamine antiporter